MSSEGVSFRAGLVTVVAVVSASGPVSPGLWVPLCLCPGLSPSVSSSPSLRPGSGCLSLTGPAGPPHCPLPLSAGHSAGGRGGRGSGSCRLGKSRCGWHVGRGEQGRERWMEPRWSVSVCVCVCVCERERESNRLGCSWGSGGPGRSPLHHSNGRMKLPTPSKTRRRCISPVRGLVPRAARTLCPLRRPLG